MTVPYTTPALSNTTLVTCLAASAYVDQYLGVSTLSYVQSDLVLRSYQSVDWCRTHRSDIALPKTPVVVLDQPNIYTAEEFDLQTEQQRLPASAVLPPILEATCPVDYWQQRCKYPAVYGWPLTDVTGLRTQLATDVLDGDIADSTTFADGITSEPGECWFIFEVAASASMWHIETAYTTADGSLHRYGEKTGGLLTSGGGAQAQRINWPADLTQAATTIARRLEQLQRSPGFAGYDSQPAQAVLHQVARSLDRFREI